MINQYVSVPTGRQHIQPPFERLCSGHGGGWDDSSLNLPSHLHPSCHIAGSAATPEYEVRPSPARLTVSQFLEGQ